MKTGIELITKERQEQIEKHHYTLDIDKEHNNHYQLSEAAGLLTWVGEEDYGYDAEACCPTQWDPVRWKKMMSKSYEDRLIIAGALIAAEIDRLNNL